MLVDTSESPPLRGLYVAFEVTNNDAVDYDDVWVSLGGFGDEDAPGNLVRVARHEAENPADPPEDWFAAYRIGPLAPGASDTAFFYLEVTDPTSFVVTGTETRPDLKVWDGLPSLGSAIPANLSLPVCTSGANRACALPSGAVEWPFVAAETLTAVSNRVLDTTRLADTPVVGTRLEVQVVGQSGLMGTGADYDGDGDPDSFAGFSPAAHVTWPSGPMRLTGVSVAVSGPSACGLPDCTCTSDPPAPGECDFVRQDGGPPACEMRAVPATPDPTCIVFESDDSLQLILEDGINSDYVATYEFRVRESWPVEVLGPVQYINSGAQLKHTSLSLDDCLDAESELDPEGTGCCQLPDVHCIGPLLPDEIHLELERGPGAGEVTLFWTGADSPYEVYRSSDPADVIRPELEIGETADPSYLDTPPPAGAHFYKVGGACYPAPESCNGEDDDCDGSTDEDAVCDSCSNGVQDGIETDVDCGGVCPDCADGQSCLVHDDCLGDYCNPVTLTCGPQPCSAAVECGSGFCVDGYCCDSACFESCDACDAPGLEGTCTVSPDGSPGSPSCSPYLCDGFAASCPFSGAGNDDCAAGFTCDPTNHCVAALPNGSPCIAPGECLSGNCVDGYCCDGACFESCDACDAPGLEGTCTVWPDGSPGSRSCSPYLCDGIAPVCPILCLTGEDCALGFICNAVNECVPF
jgi:hypothetical protein